MMALSRKPDVTADHTHMKQTASHLVIDFINGLIHYLPGGLNAAIIGGCEREYVFEGATEVHSRVPIAVLPSVERRMLFYVSQAYDQQHRVCMVRSLFEDPCLV